MRTLILLLLALVTARADVASTDGDAAAILGRVLAARPAKDFALKARLFVARDREPVLLEILAKNSAAETRTVYRSGATEFLIVQPENGTARLFQKGAGELTGPQRTATLLDSSFSLYDLALPFLRWPDAKSLGDDRTRGRDCHAIEVRAAGEPYARAKLWIDKEYCGLLRAEVFNGSDALVKRFAVTSFKRIGEVWVPRGLEMARVPAGQALPAQEKSRIEVYDGDYDAKLPDEWFAVERFAAPAN